ncbi:MAG: IMP cyclohydrolase [Oscillospiraceae bacterium]|nr:IMP cyclohydrolase [Oscillospiraceae bacterium]
MNKCNIYELLQKNPYPGRGILIGCSEEQSIVMAYFIMGRSENSRNRIFEKTEDGIRTKAFEPDKMTDPSLVIYSPVRVFNGLTIVTNGDQTDTIFEFLKQGQDFRNALLSRKFEPDAPNYTPRISGLIKPDGSYALSILKTSNGNPNCCNRYFYEYSSAMPELGHFISTYQTDGEPLPSFDGEPISVDVTISGGLERFAYSMWDALNAENKVSLYVCNMNAKTGEKQDLIINKNS